MYSIDHIILLVQKLLFEACVNHEATIAPTEGTIADTVAIAKKDLKKGDRLDSIGGYTVYGVIEEHRIVKNENLVPIGLINERTKVLKDIIKGEPITYDMVELDTTMEIYKLRQIQDKEIG